MSCVADDGIKTDSGLTSSGVTGLDGVTSGGEGTSKEIPEGGGIMSLLLRLDISDAADPGAIFRSTLYCPLPLDMTMTHS